MKFRAGTGACPYRDDFMLRTIIFDMDGVICDSEPLHMKAFQQVLTEESISITDQEYYERYLAHDDRGSFESALAVHQRPKPDLQKLKGLITRKARYFEELMKGDLVIYPGVDYFVRKASERYALALASIERPARREWKG
jgi:beta-phosphoglucomutase-like phosphatase (HAD superfamily)